MKLYQMAHLHNSVMAKIQNIVTLDKEHCEYTKMIESILKAFSVSKSIFSFGIGALVGKLMPFEYSIKATNLHKSCKLGEFRTVLSLIVVF